MNSLNVWMNGELVGEWSITRTGTHLLRYDKAWEKSPRSRPLSLSLPLTSNLEVRGSVVENYFDNLLPDSVDIRRRIRSRFQTQSMSAFNLLTAIGRDCVGAVQLLPPDQEPEGWNQVDAVRLSEAEVEEHLRNVTATPPFGNAEEDPDDFRISIAGAQEKTALLSMGGKWFRPLGATPTTHILKLPLGLVGGFRGDFSDSVENEWFCSHFLRELQLPVAATQMAQFGKQRVLITTRFDRRWVGVDADSVDSRRFKPAKGIWIARLPQEDFCQATGCPPTKKYESDGGPSIETGLSLLVNSAAAEYDRTVFVLAQLAFWLLAATDGHGKNFSLHHLAGGAYGMTPLYDVLSAWPIIGSRANQLPLQKAKLAMALRGKSAHYRLNEIRTRHWRELAQRTAVPGLWQQMISLVERAAPAIERLTDTLPASFPEKVAKKIGDGVTGQVRTFLDDVA